MTRATISLVDTYCIAANWQSSIDNNIQELARYEDGPYDVFVREINREITQWSKRRDKAVFEAPRDQQRPDRL